MTSQLFHANAAGERTVAITTTPAAYGGLEQVTAELVRGLRTRGRRVLLVVVLEPHVKEPDWVAELRSESVDIAVLRMAGRDYLGELRAVRQLLTSRNIAVVHTHGYRADLIHGRAARGAGVPTVSTVHGFTGRGPRGRLYEWLQRRALRAFDRVVAVSRPIAQNLEASGVPAKNIRFISNGLPRPREHYLARAEARLALSLPSEGQVVGWVGRVSAEKGPDIMIRAASGLPAGTHCCLVGDGPDLASTRALALSLGLDARIRFAGARAGASAYFRAFDVLALSSRTEGTPMVILEAARASIPVVATSVGGVPDVLGTDGGWLVPSEDPEALGLAIASALRDPDLSRIRATALLKRLEDQAGVNDWIGQYSRVYDDLIAD